MHEDIHTPTKHPTKVKYNKKTDNEENINHHVDTSQKARTSNSNRSKAPHNLLAFIRSVSQRVKVGFSDIKSLAKSHK